jgi:hypothetical protein
MTTLSDSTWRALSHEYLDGHPRDDQHRAIDNADRLADFVSRQTEVVTDVGGDAITAIYAAYSGVRWVPVDNSEPYADFDALRTARRLGSPLEVSDLYHDHPVFSREENLRFRVWHDTAHLDCNLGFSADEELDLFRLQAQRFPAGRTELVDALFSESVYQLAAAKVLGTFPDKQFVRTPGPVGRAVLDGWGFAR